MRRVEATDHYTAMTENELKQKVLAAAYDQGWLVYHRTQSTIRGSQGAGYPDLTLARDGYVFWMELKAQGAGLMPAQKVWHGALGGQVYIIRPADLYNGLVGELLA